ncbi:hypothetical protein [Alloactinosynnema sp. L-07]|nr:hypothetical protein [Alloactinosynnema sp. L-07]
MVVNNALRERDRRLVIDVRHDPGGAGPAEVSAGLTAAAADRPARRSGGPATPD